MSLGETSEPADLRQALAQALRDPSLQLAFWLPGARRYVGADGRPVELPGADAGRSSTTIERDGQPIAALVMIPRSSTTRSWCSRCARPPVWRLRTSACRPSCAPGWSSSRPRGPGLCRPPTPNGGGSSAISRRHPAAAGVDRDVARPARAPAPADGAAAPIVRETREALTVALQELRELTHGIHPALLSERGLAAALEELCGRAALPTRLRFQIAARLPEQLKTAAYLFASEALTNAASTPTPARSR